MQGAGLFSSALAGVALAQEFNTDLLNGHWTKLAEGPWGAREGLMVTSLGDQMVLTGGRGTHGVGFSGGNDVWRSKDGREWMKAPEAAWGRRSYHILIGPDASGCLFLMGGQTFSHFYNDVWKTCDNAETWTQVTKEAPWGGRAGLAGIMHNGKLVIAGGCHDNVPYDPGFFRTFYEDVWSSEDGKNWELVTNQPGWKGRSGPRLVSFANQLYLIAGEVGFTDSTQLADVWRSADDGKTWSLVQATPSYSARSGHGVVVLPGYMVMIAGWPELSDIYYTKDGSDWRKSSGLAWNCNSTACGKYDFWPVVHQGKLFTLGGSGSSSTFGKLYADTWSLDLQKVEPAPADYKCPGSGSAIHASNKVTAVASASCADVIAEMKARASAQGGWVDPHNGGIYSVISSSDTELQTQRTTNPKTSVGGKVYTDKQIFMFTTQGASCEIKGCSESQTTSVADMSTNYCDMRNLYCGSADGCKTVSKDFTSTQSSVQPSIGAGTDFSQCIVNSAIQV